MEERNIDFEIPLSEEQWSQLGQRAAALGPDGAGFDWREDDPERIHVYLRETEARGLWEEFVSDPELYGEDKLEIAQFVFNDGRPFGHLEAPPAADEPAINSLEESGMEIGQEKWVRAKWQQLMKDAGLT